MWNTLLHRNNRGSGIVTVMVAVSFVAILGALLLYSSFINYQVKVTERDSNATFYDAETVMNEVRAGVQALVSESLATAYTKVLVNYGSYDETGDNTAQRALFNYFVEALSPLYTGNQLSQSTLDSYIKNDAGVTITTPNKDKYGNDIVSFVQNIDGNLITLRGIKVSLVRNGYESTMESDITIRVPLFNFAGRVDISTNNLNGLVSVAKTGIEAGVGDGVIRGNAYGGTLTSEHGKLSMDNGLLVIQGGVTVKKELELGENAILWAQDILMGDNGKATLKGAAYVADDLNLSGKYADVTLSGQYYGFGNSPSDASKSSAILINGAHTSLRLDNLKRLMLGGHSFILDVDDVTNNAYSAKDVLMGESISIKSNQLAYLIPASDLGDNITSNPYIFGPITNPENITFPAVPEYVPVSYLENNVEKTDTVKVITIVHYLSGMPNYRLLYYLYDFRDDMDLAEKHFAYYFQQNSDDITRYLKTYSAILDGVNEAEKYGTAGSTLYLDDSGSEAVAKLLESTNVYALSSESMSKQFHNLCQSMNPNFDMENAAADYSPYSFFVDEAALASKVSQLDIPAGSGFGLFWPESIAAADRTNANATAILSTSDISFNAEVYPAVRLVLCTGNVSLSKSFTGLVFCSGTLNINTGATLSYTSVNEINTAMMSKNGSLRFDDFMLVKGDSVEGASGGGSTWDLDYLVSYTNWDKSPELPE